jgi:hypothetical protein
MQQIADWLKTLGMSEYVERFAENDIDTSFALDAYWKSGGGQSGVRNSPYADRNT